MKVVVRAKADRDLDGIFDWIAKDNPAAARDMVRRIWVRIERLALSEFADQGRPGQVPGTRELIVSPYVIVYEPRRDRDEVTVLAILHMARDR